MVHAPTLETDRLLLRPPQLSDFDDYLAYWQTPEVVRFIGGSPVGREEVWTKLLRQAGLWHFFGFGFFVLTEKASGRFAGAAGFQELCRDLQPSISGSLEAGWGLRPEFQGQGYAQEAMTAALDWAGRRFPERDYSCIIDPENHASLRLARRLGFGEEVQTAYLGEPIVVLRKSRRG